MGRWSYSSKLLSSLLVPFSTLHTSFCSRYYLHQLAGDVEVLPPADTPSTSEGGESPAPEAAASTKRSSLRVFRAEITVHFEAPVVVIEWTSNPVTDMYADAVLAAVLQAETNPIPAKSELSMLEGLGELMESVVDIPPLVKVDNEHFRDCLVELLGEIFGGEALAKSTLLKASGEDRVVLEVDGVVAEIHVATMVRSIWMGHSDGD